MKTCHIQSLLSEQLPGCFAGFGQSSIQLDADMLTEVLMGMPYISWLCIMKIKMAMSEGSQTYTDPASGYMVSNLILLVAESFMSSYSAAFLYRCS